MFSVKEYDAAQFGRNSVVAFSRHFHTTTAVTRSGHLSLQSVFYLLPNACQMRKQKNFSGKKEIRAAQACEHSRQTGKLSDDLNPMRDRYIEKAGRHVVRLFRMV